MPEQQQAKSQNQTAQKPATSLNYHQRVIAAASVILAAMIGVQGNIRVWYGDPLVDVIPWMAVQGAALIMEAAKETEPKSPSDK